MLVRNFCVAVALFFILNSSLSIAHAQTEKDHQIAYAPPRLDLIPSAIESYDNKTSITEFSSRDLSVFAENRVREVLSRPSLDLSAHDGKGKRRYLPVLLSALVPGAGELYLGYVKRAVALMAVEAGAWAGYTYYHGKGLDTREEYEGFADEHWSVRKWGTDHPEIYGLGVFTPAQMDSVGQIVSGTGSWPGYIPWVSRQEDKQHYYENIGKYDWFISGWEDFDPTLDPFPRDTDLRDEYRSLRRESNDQLDDANLFIYLSLATRVFSLVETILLTRNLDDEVELGSLENRFELKARPKGSGGGEIALEYRFK